MRSRIAVPAALAALIAAAAPSAAREPGPRSVPSLNEYRSATGIAVRYPPRWWRVDGHLTPCVNPIQRVAFAGRGAFVMLQEFLGLSDAELRRFPRRPERFRLRGAPTRHLCCTPTSRPGWVLEFQDGGRAFYVYVYLGWRRTKREALAILDSLRISPSPKRAP